MRRLARWLFVPYLVGACGVAAASPAARAGEVVFDFAGVDRLWAIVSELERDEEPAPETWDALVRTPGYAALIAHEPGYGLAYLQRHLRLVFKPSMAADLGKAPRSAALGHFLALKEKRTALEAFQMRVQQAEVAREGLELVRPWLPADTLARVKPPGVSFVVFAADARGGYGPLIFDLLYAFEKGDTFGRLFAHEAFHYYRRASPAVDPGQVILGYRGVLEALGKIQDEGIADQIDKAAAIEAGGEPATAYDRDYARAMADTPSVLSALDDLLTRLGDSPRDATRIGSQMHAAIPMSGHPTGYVMTRAVRAHAGRPEVVRTFNNPFAFFCLYNAAAIRDPALPRLSNLAISALDRVARAVGVPLEPALVSAARFEGVDASALAHFAAIADRLATDEEPDAALWDSLFRSPGARVYFAEEGDSRESLKDALALAYRPSRAAALQKALERPSRTVRYFADYRKEIAGIASAWAEWQRSAALTRAMDQAWPYLPPDARQVLAGTTLTLTYLGYADLRYGYDLLLVDPMVIRQMSAERLASYVRLHLLTRHRRAVRPYDRSALTVRQAAFLDVWEAVQQRGLADLMSRDLNDPEQPDARKRYDARLGEAAGLLGRLDAIMSRAAGDASAWREFEDLPRDLYVGQGCPLGYFMASAARAVLGSEALAAVTGDPVAFVRLYQKAARTKGGLPLFSDESLALLAQIEREALAGAARARR